MKNKNQEFPINYFTIFIAYHTKGRWHTAVTTNETSAEEKLKKHSVYSAGILQFLFNL